MNEANILLKVTNMQRVQVTFAAPKTVRLKTNPNGKLQMKGKEGLEGYIRPNAHTAELSDLVRILLPLGPPDKQDTCTPSKTPPWLGIPIKV